MSTINHFGLDFVGRKDKADKDYVFIFARITLNGEETELSIKERVPYAKWDSKHEQVTGRAMT